jgi:hypothetical protein
MKIFLAGVESGDSKEIVEKGIIENAFVSYYYMRGKNNNDYLKFVRKNVKCIIVDSGAHTFFSERADEGLSVSVLRKKTKTKGTPQEYWEKYKQWLVLNYDLFDYYVELDIGEIVGQETVLQWREELKQLGIYKKCITVVHPAVVNFDDFLKMQKQMKRFGGDKMNKMMQKMQNMGGQLPPEFQNYL